MKLAACHQLGVYSLSGHWYRAVQLAHYRSLLSQGHTPTGASRFNAGSVRNPFPILYFAQDQQLALFEVRALVGSAVPVGVYFPNPSASWVVIAVRVRLQHVVDLTQAKARRTIRMSVQELTGDWVGYRRRRPIPPTKHPYTDIPTQLLGAALVAMPNIEAFLTYSAIDSSRKSLVVFPDKLQTGSWVKFFNPVSGGIDRIP